MIAVHDLRFAWPGFAFALDAWSVPAGATAAVVGPSGCGKSTLLGLLAGELVPAQGRVEVAGAEISALGEAARRAHRLASVGLVFQDHPLVPYLDLVDNVTLPYRLGLSRDAGATERARGLLDGLGLARHHRRPEALSQGERQRVAIARALVTEPAVVLADEPTSGLDPSRTDAVVDLLTGLARERGTTLVMVTHDLRLVDRFDATLDLGAA